MITIKFSLPTNLYTLRVKCPKCGKKGIGFADHPHAFGWKDYDFVKCRYCLGRWKAENFAGWMAQQDEYKEHVNPALSVD